MATALRRSLLRRHILLLPRLRHISTQPNPDPKPNNNPHPDPKPLTLLRSAIKSESDPTRIAELFQSSTHLPRFLSDRPLFRLTAYKLNRLHRPDLLFRILDPLTSPEPEPKPEGFLTRILSLYSSSNLLDEAQQLFDKIPQRTQLSLSALLSALLDHKRYDLAIEKFETMPKELGIEVSVVLYNLYIKALCSKGKIGRAREVITEMAEWKGVAPNVVTYNEILSGFLKKGDKDGFEEVLKEMSEKGLEPNSFTYNCRIVMFCKKEQGFRAEEVLELMVSKGVRPYLTSFNEIIDGYCKEGNLGSAVRVFKRMVVLQRVQGKDGVSPDGNTFKVLVRSLVEKGEFDTGLEICKQSLARKFALPFEVVKGLVEGLVKNAKVDEAKDVVGKMKLIVRGQAAEDWKKLESSLAL